MGERRGAREWAMQLLFQSDFNPPEPGAGNYVDEGFWAAKDATERARAFTDELVQGVLRHKEDIDRRLAGYAEHWDLHRMSAVDRNVMRVAMYEMLYRADIPPVVSINEAVEIAKQFSGEDSGRFVNGILDRARKDLKRPARTAGGMGENQPPSEPTPLEAESTS